MKALCFLLILSLSLCDLDLKRQQHIVSKVNRLKTTWTAKLNFRDIKPLLGLKRSDKNILPEKKFTEAELNDELPENFDLRTAHPECDMIGEVRDQAKCGSCWAFGSVECMSDRLCIHSKGKIKTRVSALHLLSCCDTCGMGCFGGYPPFAYYYWEKSGIPSGGLYGDKNSCKPYFLPPCDDHMHKCQDYQHTPECTSECIPEYPKSLEEDKTYGKESYIVNGEKEMMKEIYDNGSCTISMNIYEDFGNYEKGIYQHVTGKPLGGHAIKVIGWGVENGVKYWLFVNSWNETWGEKGLFRVLRGVNECGVEKSVACGIPKIPE